MSEAVAESEAHFRKETEKRVAHSGGWSEEGALDYAIDVDGRLAGAVRVGSKEFLLPPGVYELGIEFYADGDRGRGLGTQALRRFIPEVFDHGAIRVQGHTHVENKPMIRLFERYGFVREGVLRHYFPMPERSGDVALYGLIRPDYEQRRSEF